MTEQLSNRTNTLLQQAWQSSAPWIAPPVAASSAIVFAYPGMVAKTAIQQDKTPPKGYSIKLNKEVGFLMFATFLLVGSQVNLQKKGEQLLQDKYFNHQKNWKATLAVSAVVGFATSPLVGVFNGYTMTPPQPGLTTLRNLSLKQVTAMTLQESCFVAGISVAEIVERYAKEKLGENKTVEFATTYVCGAVSSVPGHPANTWLSRSQAKLKNSTRATLRSLPVRANACGIFYVVYKVVKDFIMPKNND